MAYVWVHVVEHQPRSFSPQEHNLQLSKKRKKENKNIEISYFLVTICYGVTSFTSDVVTLTTPLRYATYANLSCYVIYAVMLRYLRYVMFC